MTVITTLGLQMATLKVTQIGNSLGVILPKEVAARLKVDKGKAGEEILPVLWQDNYVSLLPGEKREITATYRASELGGASPYVEVKGWNTE